MVKLNSIYTRTGDEGETGLVGGERRKKQDPRVEAYGTVDEANAAIGCARLHTKGDYDDMLARVQQDLFDLGADLATPGYSQQDLRIVPELVTRLENEIDQINAHLAPLTSFVLPGGSAGAAHLHMARTIVRRGERDICRLSELEVVNPLTITYMNRLSDFLFVLARAVNENGAADVLWKPGANRGKGAG
ncbi:MAG: cob(I)yrinic acid a,c-diamide adenosyltransferase [Rickettsiales bacterium]|nr:cob(I)yrinic acid a,c-diamide adenosyltransferase [Rickettsiales bacterium]